MALTIPFQSVVSTIGSAGFVTATTVTGGSAPCIYLVQFDISNLPGTSTLELIVEVDNASASLQTIYDEVFAGPSVSPFIIDVGARLAPDGNITVGFDQPSGSDVFDVPIVLGKLTT